MYLVFLSPPPPQKKTFVSDSFWDDCNFGGRGWGGGINKVHYGLGEKGALGKNGMYKRVKRASFVIVINV